VDVAFRRASRLDPRNASLLYELRCLPLSLLRRYPEAIAACRQALALAPDFQAPHLEIGWTYVKWKGELDTLRAAISSLPLEAARGQALMLAFYERRPDSVLALLRAMPRPDPWFPNGSSTPRALTAAWAHLLRRDSAAARAAFASAATWLDSVERARPGEGSDGWVVHGERGVALAALGRRTEAWRETHWLEQSAMYRRDEFSGEHAARARQHILMLLGQRDSALAEIERLLASPSMLTVHVLRLDPQWDPIRNDARFQALLVKYADPERH
jgi:serine/threonine-protein kinase